MKKTGQYFLSLIKVLSLKKSKLVFQYKKLKAPSMVVMQVSPHPDDECINGALALRLKDELGASVINYPYTLGSDQKRQKARLKELKKACAFLDFSLYPVKENTADEFARAVEICKPNIIILPHQNDGHQTHIRTSLECLEALTKINFSGEIYFYEYWSYMTSPNLLLEVPPYHVKKLMQALTFHAGEIKRNAYHLTLPHWMIDNVRRGQEIVGSNTTKKLDLTFANLYLKAKMQKGALFLDGTKRIVSIKDKWS